LNTTYDEQLDNTYSDFYNAFFKILRVCLSFRPWPKRIT